MVFLVSAITEVYFAQVEESVAAASCFLPFPPFLACAHFSLANHQFLNCMSMAQDDFADWAEEEEDDEADECSYDWDSDCDAADDVFFKGNVYCLYTHVNVPVFAFE